MVHRFPKLRAKIISQFEEKVKGSAEMRQALETVRASRKLDGKELWECSICGKQGIPNNQYADHYAKCFLKSILKGKIPN